MTTSMTLFCQLLALGRAPNKDRDRSIRSQLNSRCQLVCLLSLFIAIYIAKTKALLPTVWSVPNVPFNSVNLTTILPEPCDRLQRRRRDPPPRKYPKPNAGLFHERVPPSLKRLDGHILRIRYLIS